MLAAFQELLYATWIEGVMAQETIDLEASVLYPDVKVITIEEVIRELAAKNKKAQASQS